MNTTELLLLVGGSSGVGWAGRMPTRAEKLAILASFATHNDRHGSPVFDPFWCGLSPDRRREWLEDKRALGLTHLVISRTWQYQRYTDKTGHQAGTISRGEFADRIREAFDGGLLPLVWLPFDDDAAGEASVYDGRMAEELRSLLPVKDLIAGVSHAWETLGAWSSKAIVDACALMRRILGPDVPLILHGRDNERFTGASYGGEGTRANTPAGYVWMDYRDASRPGIGAYVEEDDPARGDEAGWWAFVDFDVFAWESRHGSDGPSFVDGDPNPNSNTWLGRFLEGFERFAPAGTYIPALNRNVRETDMNGNRAPDWFGGMPKRPVCCPFELQEYEDATDTVSDARITHVANLLASYGVTTFGSGVPSAYQQEAA